MPTKDEFNSFVSSIGEKYPRLAQEKVYCAMDGVKLYLQQAGDAKIQERFYNGWRHDHYVTNVFMFTPDGMIRLMVINLPGDTHDSTAAHYGFFYDKLEDFFKKYGGKCVVDSAFSLIRRPYLLKSSRTDATSEDAYGMMLNVEATSLRQMAEWGMRGFQGSFPRMKDRLVYEEDGERKRIIQLTVMLYNARSRLVGINQIKNVFYPNLIKENHLYQEILMQDE
jgi:hypothetical protein